MYSLRLGCPNFCFPSAKPDPINGLSRSIFFPDEAISDHPRFRTVVHTIRSRRGRKVAIKVPIFKDFHTKEPFLEEFDDCEAMSAREADHVYMDCVGFGMGCCCLQVTFQATSLNEAVHLYDQLNPICPIAMALSASSPIQRGYLIDYDCRWSVISQAMDDRTKEELGEEPYTHSERGINKSRYDSIDSYLSPYGLQYNDIELKYNEEYYETMIKEGIDPPIAKHVAHLFIRDPIIVYKENLDQDDESQTDHFEGIQSTNWQSLRFKPPPFDSIYIGWRVEFRPMEVQLTDFENAAYAVFITLLTRVILAYKLNLLIPISKVDENMKRAQMKDAVNEGKFWFRKDIENESKDDKYLDSEEPCVQMTIDEIINGSHQFIGLVPLIKKYLSSIEIDGTTNCMLKKYLNLISGRASGKIVTTAKWIRNFVRNHSDYKFDSCVSDLTNYDLLKQSVLITESNSISQFIQ